MSLKTEAQLATEVLEEMGVVGAGETAAAEDTTKVTAAYANKYAELAAPGLELVYWPLAEIPQAIFTIVRDLVINEVQGAFGNALSAADKDAQETIILRKLRRHASIEKSGQPTQAEYF